MPAGAPCGPPAPDRGFVAADVAALRGGARLATPPDGVIEDAFPKQRVAIRAVAHSRKYRFNLVPRTHLVVVHHPTGGPTGPWIQVVVRAGRTTSQDVPGECG